MQECDAICDFEGGTHVMGDHHLGDAHSLEFHDQSVDDTGRNWIEAGCGFVMQHDFWMTDERSSESGSFSHPT